LASRIIGKKLYRQFELSYEMDQRDDRYVQVTCTESEHFQLVQHLRLRELYGMEKATKLRAAAMERIVAAKKRRPTK
jgi:hypothetical protein